MFVLPKITVQVLRVLMIALFFTVSTGLVFPCSKNLVLFRLMPTAPGARGAVIQLLAEPHTLNQGRPGVCPHQRHPATQNLL